MPGSSGKRAGFFDRVAREGGIDISFPYTGESYDAAALIVLAIQAGGSADSTSISKNIKVSFKLIKVFFKPGHRLLTPNKGINQRYLKHWADVADKICFTRT